MVRVQHVLHFLKKKYYEALSGSLILLVSKYFWVKTMKYDELISLARDYYEGNPPELKNIRNDKSLFDLEWCNGLSKEINLWNYWQGAAQDRVNVMIVGQDYGSVDRDLFSEVLNSKKYNVKDVSKMYIDRIQTDKNSQTDRMLIHLTKEGLGEEYSADIPANKNLFMTNLCLGYRVGGGLSGGEIFSCLKHDSIYFVELVKIKRPDVVIVLGANTYLAALTGLSCAGVDIDEYYMKQVNTSFCTLLDNNKNKKVIKLDGCKFDMVGVAHTGSYGRMNRKRYSEKYNNSDIESKDIMLNDWKAI